MSDGLLFRDAAAKDRANGFTEEWKRYEFGLAVVESKRWGRPLAPPRYSGSAAERNRAGRGNTHYHRDMAKTTRND